MFSRLRRLNADMNFAISDVKDVDNPQSIGSRFMTLLCDYFSLQVEVFLQIRWLLFIEYKSSFVKAQYLHILTAISLIFIFLQYCLYITYHFNYTLNSPLFLLCNYLSYLHNSYLLMFDIRLLRLDPNNLKPRPFNYLLLLPNIPLAWIFLSPVITGHDKLFSLFSIIHFSYFFIVIAVMSPLNKCTICVVIYHIVLSIYRINEIFDAETGIFITFVLVVHTGIFFSLSLQRQLFGSRLITAKQEVEDNLFIRSNALSFISHECRTPLHCILSTLDLVKDEVILPAEQKESITSLHVVGTFLLEHLNSMLLLANAEQDKAFFKSSRFQLSSLLRKTLDMTKRMAVDFNCTVDINVSTEVQVFDFVVSDEVRVRQILLNVMGNGIKHSVNGNVVLYVSWCHDICNPNLPNGAFCANTPDDETFVSDDLGVECEKRQGLLFRIEDNGEGIDSRYLNRIFDMYAQQHKNSHVQIDNMAGMGLGLTICLRLVQMMGGGLWVWSKQVHGTIFIITIPAVRDRNRALNVEVPLRIEYTPLPRDQIKHLGVLYCDDHAINRKVKKRQLMKLGFELLYECVHGQEAVCVYMSLLKRGIPARFILLDMHTPFLNGRDAAQQIRDITKNVGITQPYIVIVTADATLVAESMDDSSSLACVNDVLLKPCNIETLLRCSTLAIDHLNMSTHDGGENGVRRSQRSSSPATSDTIARSTGSPATTALTENYLTPRRSQRISNVTVSKADSTRRRIYETVAETVSTPYNLRSRKKMNYKF